MQRLNVFQHVDFTFVTYLISLYQSYLYLHLPTKHAIYAESENRIIPLEALSESMKPICKELCLEHEFALIATRLRQGDIFIIQDHQDHLITLLPCENLRKLTMGICGILTLPIKFDRKFHDYPNEFHPSISFESSCEIICEMLNINPIVPRIMMLDNEALDLVEKLFHFPKKAVF